MRLFVSYAHVDSVRVADLAAVLRAAGFDPWWDDSLEPGDDWKAELRRRIAACDAFLYLLSTDSVESEWCGWELAQAAELSKPIVPILVRAGTPLPSSIAHLQYLDATAGLRNTDVARLVGKLGRMEQQQIREPVPYHVTPAGTPARFRQPLPKNYRTIAQGYLQPLTHGLSPCEWKAVPPSKRPPTSKIIGIDFGTTISSVAVQDDGDIELIPNDFGETSTPSAVAIATDGTVLTGSRAVDFMLVRPERGVLEVKRLFGYDLLKEFNGPPVLEVDGTAYAPVDFAAFILRRLREDAESHLQSSVHEVVLAAPAYFDASQCATLMLAAEMAGLKVLRVVPEPVAACMGVRWPAQSGDHTMVYDLGGGTFDVSIVDVADGVFEVKAVNGDTRLGGADFDRALVDYSVEVFRRTTGIDLGSDAAALMRIRDAAERAKIALSSARAAIISVPFIASIGARGLHLEVELTRTRFNELTHALVERTERLSRAVLEDAGLSPGEIQTVLVVGRAARAQSIRLALEDIFGPRLRAAPDHVVALGAALQGGVLAGTVKNWLLLDSLSHTLRVQVDGGRTVPLIVRNTTIPNIRSFTLTTQRPNQSRLLVRILAGESSWADQDQPLMDILVGCDPGPTTAAEAQLTLEIDANSTLTVTVRLTNSSIKREESFGLRQGVHRPVSLEGSPVPFDTAILPRLDYRVHLAQLPEAERVELLTVQRWLCRTATDLVLDRIGPGAAEGWWKRLDDWLRSNPAAPVPSDFADAKSLNVFDLERELLADALEQRYEMSLLSLRYCSSINSMADELIRTLKKMQA